MSDYKQVVHDRDRVCQCCGTSGRKGNILTVHHVIARCHKGPNTPENCVLLCQRCHRALHQQQGYPVRIKDKSKKKNKKRRR